MICLIAAISGADPVSATTCASFTSFYDHGIGILTGKKLGDQATSVEAYLFPQDIDLVFIRPAGLRARNTVTVNSANILEVDPQASGLESRDVVRDNGAVFSFTPIAVKRR